MTEPRGCRRTRIDAYDELRPFILESLKQRGQTRAALARALGLSTSMMTALLKEKRSFRSELVEPLAEFFELDHAGKVRLAALIDLDNDSARARQAARAFLRAHSSEKKSPSLGESWQAAAIYQLAFCDGFRADPRWISKTLVPSIPVDEVAVLLTRLLRDGYLTRSDGGELLPVPMVDHMGGTAVHDQRRVFELAGESLKRFYGNERYLAGLTTSLSDEDLDWFLGQVRELEQAVLGEIMAGVEKANRVYCFGIQLFPVTKEM